LTVRILSTKGQFRWESQSVFVGFNNAFGRAKTKPAETKERLTLNKAEDCSLKNQYEGRVAYFSYSIVGILKFKNFYQY
jgi:hypothetical protein